MHRAFALPLLLLCLPLLAQEIPAPTELMGEPFFIKKKWLIEPDNHQDYRSDDRLGYLTLDPYAGKLFIAHGPRVEIVDIETGALEARITGLKDAKSIVLDPTGAVAYIADNAAGAVAVLDRSTQQIVETIPSCVGGIALDLEPVSGLLFEVCSGSESAPSPPREGSTSQRVHGTATKKNVDEGTSFVAVIDPESKKERATQPIAGKLGFVKADGNGAVYVAFSDRSGLLRIDAVALRGTLRRGTLASDGTTRLSAWDPVSSSPVRASSVEASGTALASGVLRYVRLDDQCGHPRGLAADSAHFRLFVACDNANLVVANAQTGASIAWLPTGPGTDDVGYDADHRLVFAANGGNAGSLTIIHQHNTDSYHVVQNLPTSQKARTLAVDETSGWVYLVTPFRGVNPEHAMSGGKADPAGNFVVLAIGK